MEWASKSKYNSFNSYKGLTYYQNYRAIVDWLNGADNLPSPVECSLDPIASCNLRCYYCNSQRYLRENPREIPDSYKQLSTEHMIGLIDFFAGWGVKGICFGGGGESLLHEGTWGLYSYIVSKGMEPSVVTNGTVSSPAIDAALMHCRWVGVSVDAAKRKTYECIKKVDFLPSVLKNIESWAMKKSKTGSKVDISFKFLVLPENINEMYEACKLAKELGVQDFHVRPVDLERRDFKMAMKLNLDIPKIMEIFQKCHEEEGENFRVFTVMHKYDPEFHVKHEFNKCLAAPLVIQCCTDGYVYNCVDHRIEERFRMGAHYPKPEDILRFWGSNQHRQLLKGIKPHRECSRCTWGEYNRQISECVMEDRLCRNFP